ncbi:Flp pilus assembly protein CpaB [Idiomarina baltica]|uniref:Flp pilus assembly protein CpaB n=1 Tax=Idiomarina baltica OS145 TaxID=314276 RepID=A0ABM9WMH3_9GAMM|nr:Flp pilus assembly protein CpaB [Idiomarina baltica]EAQ32097.1 Flp pilus assembly protein CpaB [Idiomarina baltica OS145]MBR37821.1 Flp pilus assembly protein CpaB [Idiomarina sp.]
MKAKKQWVILLLMSIVLTAFTLWLLRSYLNYETAKRLKAETPPEQAIVVFNQDLKAGTLVDASMLSLRQYPTHLVNPGWMTEDYVGTILDLPIKRAVTAGSPVEETQFELNYQKRMADRLPENHWAITLPVDLMQLHDGQLQPDDRVDLVSKKPMQDSLSVVENLRVLSVNGTDLGQGMSVTLAVSAKQRFRLGQMIGDGIQWWVRSTGKRQPWQTYERRSAILDW